MFDTFHSYEEKITLELIEFPILSGKSPHAIKSHYKRTIEILVEKKNCAG